MAKQIINVDKKLVGWKCKMCGRMVNVALATPTVMETEDVIINTWDYGHQHKKVIQIIGGREYVIEGND